ncbi:MAG TPA: TonB family protein [Longimicrobiales bacterium]|jgi:periplasmic protein TonB|nr:TonB family protein [Longimicrobiales bacterium]
MEQMSTFDTANDRFKRGFGDWFWYSIAGAALFHVVLFAFFPNLSSADVSITTESMEAIDIPDNIEIPPPPEQIARPATPVVSAADISEDITIAPTTFDANPIENLPPPPSSSAGDADLSAAPVFTPMTVAPELQNRADVQRALVRNYPPLLRDAGIGGSPTVHFFIDENGRVLKTLLSKSSGYPALDDAAIAVAQQMKFSPALNRDKKVQVWVEIPIVFTAK